MSATTSNYSERLLRRDDPVSGLDAWALSKIGPFTPDAERIHDADGGAA